MAARLNRLTDIQIQVRLTLFLAAIFLSGSIPAAPNGQEQEAKSAPIRVLFVGNSYTYVENLPQIVSIMAEEKGIPLVAQQITAGGATLEHHWRGERELTTVKKIESGNFDAVILQDQSLRPIDDPETTIRDIGLFCEHIRKAGATPYIFLTWARERVPQMQDQLTKTYLRAARVNNAKVVPVGLAWELARKLRSDISLYREDGSHPSRLGTYLSACVFFAVLTGKSPRGLPNNPTTTDKLGESITLMWVNRHDAEFLQRVAEQTINTFLSEQGAPADADKPRR